MLKKKTIFYGWWVLLACGLTQLFFSATFLSGFSALIDPIVDEFGWSYALVSLAFTFRGFEAGIFAPLVGFLVDRFRPRKLLFIGSFSGALGLLLFSRMHSLTGFFVSVIILGVSLSLNSSVVVMTAAAYWFKQRPGLAMGLLSMGVGAGGLFMPLIIILIDRIGWRDSLGIFAVLALVLITPLSLVVKDPPGEGKDSSSARKKGPVNTGEGMSVREVLRQKAFWLLAFSVFFTGLSNAAIQTHQIPYLVDAGLTRENAGFLVVILSISNIAGRLGFGWLGDFVPKKNSYLFAAACLLAGLAMYAYAESLLQAVPAVIFLGAGTGAVMTLRSVVQLDLFGRKAFATVQGLLISCITFGSMIAPLFAGWIFDTYETYRPAWIVFIALTFFSLPLIISLPRQKAVKMASPPREPL